MSIVVIGGNSRNIGKTSVVAGLIAALPEFRWTAIKITQYGHGVCSINGETCHCAVDQHPYAITEEKDRSAGTDTSRFLAAGAQRSIWVRTKQGNLAVAMPQLRRRMAAAGNVIIESNSLIRFLRPDLYISVLDENVSDFKTSAKELLDRADAYLVHASQSRSKWAGFSPEVFRDKPVFAFAPPDYVPEELLEFVRMRLGLAAGSRRV